MDLLPGISSEIKEKAAAVKLILMDVDGVLTEGKMYYFPGPDGLPAEFKGFNSQDGCGFHLAHHCGLKTGLISGRESPGVVERARILHISYVYQGFLEKEAIYDEILIREREAGCALKDENVAFIGDDFPDYPLIRRAGFGIAVQNARPEIKAAADYVTASNGGEGAVREVFELVLKASGLWPLALAKYGLDK